MANQYDLKRLIGTIVKSRAYQMAAVARTAEAPARGYVFRGPEIRRLSAEQFSDAIGSMTGEWERGPAAGSAARATCSRPRGGRHRPDPADIVRHLRARLARASSD